MTRRRVAILGSTGNIGVQTLEVIDALNADGQELEVVALVAHQNARLLIEQAHRHHPRIVGLTDVEAADENADALRREGREVLVGPAAAVEVARHAEVDVVVHAVVGAAGLPAALAAAAAGKRLALANKESLVVGGTLLTEAAKRGGATILPIDSEHSAVFQAMQCGRLEEIERVILTASGGPFRTWQPERMSDATVEDAMAHPTWAMGGKITVDSATMFNKALEIIEAVHLFNLPPEKVEVVIHPESVVHSMVEFRDGSTMAQLSPPDMRTPIGYALTYPHRGRPGGRRMDWREAIRLNFEPPDAARFPALRLAGEVLAAGGTAPATFNAANEVAVSRFLARRLPFGRISEVVEATLQQVSPSAVTGLECLFDADAHARRVASELAHHHEV